jgi:4-amino-4-deoxy-L-arabinose transferase-like glycosyltransferase
MKQTKLLTGSWFAKNKGIIVICAAYLVISLALFFLLTGGKAIIGGDAPSYIDTAKHLLADSFFSRDGSTPEYIRTPGYPMFLALIYWFGGSDIVVVIVQILLLTWKVYLSFRILVLLHTPKKLALVGALLLLFNIQSYGYSFSILTEPLFGFFLVLSLYFLIKYLYYGKNHWNFFAFAIACNYALLIRPILMYFNMLTVLALLIFFVLKKITFRCFALFLLCFAFTFCGWSYRNYKHSSVFIFSTIQNSNMQRYYAPIITASIKHIKTNRGGYTEGATDYHEELFLREYPEAKDHGLNEAQVDVLRGKYGTAFIKAHFKEYLWVNLTGLVNMVFAPFQTNLLFKATTLSSKLIFVRVVQGLHAIYIWLIYALFIAGLIWGKKYRGVHISIFLLSGYLAAAAAIFATNRFRDPFFPLLVLSAFSNSGAILQIINDRCKIPALNKMGNYLLED